MPREKFLRTLGAALTTVVAAATLARGADTNTYKVLYFFNTGDSGSYPSGELTLDKAGNVYGTTRSGGAANCGVVFQFTPNTDATWGGSVLHRFRGSDGCAPYAGVIFDKVGNLYGTTQGSAAYGGSSVVF